MLKKIQQYLLLNHPLLWNIKIVPALFGIVVINTLFFLSGYWLTEIDFLDRFSYNSSFAGAAFIYMGAVLMSIILFIIWLVSYSKNNAFKSFYPQSTNGLYSEWILSFVIICGLVLFPFSYKQGSILKIKSYVSEQEMIKAVETLNMVKILIPTDKTMYYQEYPTSVNNAYEMKASPNRASGNLNNEPEYVDPIEYAESHNTYYEDYPDFTQLSLLNYGSLNQFYISEGYGFTIRDNNTVKEWLRKQNKAEISKLMDDFLALQNRHSLKTNLTKEKWLELVYNPSKYPVGDFNLITSYDYESEKAGSVYSYYPENKTSNGYYLSYDELERAYDKIMNAYVETGDNVALLLFFISLSMSLSLFVFSYRATAGKSWLIALVSMGLILFINGILSFTLLAIFGGIGLTGSFAYSFILLMIFVLELISVLKKNSKRRAKGRSEIYMNHLIWFIPVVPILIFMLIYIIGSNQYSYTGYEYQNNKLYDMYLFMDKHIIGFIWANICLTFVSMWFFIQCILRKWKSLPEQ